MAKIAPSILSADFANLERDIRDIRSNGGDWVHVDVMDGLFVPNISIGIPVVQAIRPVTDLPLDVHLMIDRPIRYVEQFVKAGADWLTIHVEADQPANTLACLDKIRQLGCKAAISLKPGTPAEAARVFLPKCDMVLVMTVEPGFGGQKFMADMMPKLRTLRQMLDEVIEESESTEDYSVSSLAQRTKLDSMRQENFLDISEDTLIKEHLRLKGYLNVLNQINRQSELYELMVFYTSRKSDTKIFDDLAITEITFVNNLRKIFSKYRRNIYCSRVYICYAKTIIRRQTTFTKKRTNCSPLINHSLTIHHPIIYSSSRMC